MMAAPATHADTCDGCGARVDLEAPRIRGQGVECEPCWMQRGMDEAAAGVYAQELLW